MRLNYLGLAITSASHHDQQNKPDVVEVKKLTQAVFENAPDWVKSAAVDENGIANFFSCYKSTLVAYQTSIGGMWLFSEGYDGRFEWIGSGYDTTDWQHSALDRE